MAVTFSTTLINARLDQIETTIGTSAIMKIRTGAPPTHADDASSGTVLATLNLPSDWMTNAATRVKAMSGTWQDTSADASGTAAHFEITSSGGTVHVRGTVTATGGGGDLTVDSTNFVAAQAFAITAFQFNGGNY